MLKDISQEQAQNLGAEIKRYTGDKNLTINDYSRIILFRYHHNPEWISIIWHCTCTWKIEIKKWKNLRIIKAKKEDQTGLIKFTLFSDLIYKVKGSTRYAVTYLRVVKYSNLPYLKTTKSTTFTPNDDIKVAVTGNDSLDEKSDTIISVRISAVNMKNLNSQYTFPNCSSEIILDEEYVVCDNCD